MRKYLGIFILAILLAGCSDDFLNVDNINNSTLQNYYRNADECEKAVISAYSPLATAYGGSNMQYMLYSFEKYTKVEVNLYEDFLFSTNDGRIRDCYMYLFRGVFRCNLALEVIHRTEGKTEVMSDGVQDSLAGEALFLRAMYYFYLKTLWGNVPLVTAMPVDPKFKYSNSEDDEIWDQMEKDLLGFTDDKMGFTYSGAINTLPAKWDVKFAGRATKGAAMALLGKIYLYRHKWTEAKTYFKKVMDLGVYSLSQPKGNDSTDYVYALLANSSYVDLISKSGNAYKAENNSESVFEIQFDDQGDDFPWLPGWFNSASLSSMYYGPFGYTNLGVRKTFVDLFTDLPEHPAGLLKDPRLSATVFSEGDTLYKDDKLVKWDVSLGFEEKYGLRKGFYPTIPQERIYHDPTNYRLIKYSDILLMYAEACMMEDGDWNAAPAEAVEAVNLLMRRAGLTEYFVLKKDDIIKERSKELGCENHRFFDLMRWYKAPEGQQWVTKPSDILGKNFKTLLPIPLYEIDVNFPNLEQNAGY